MEFFRQAYWSGLQSTSQGDLSEPELEPGSPALRADSLPRSFWFRGPGGGGENPHLQPGLEIQCCWHRDHAWRQALPHSRALSGCGIKAVLIDNMQALASDQALCVGMPGQHQEGSAHILGARTWPQFQPRFLARSIRPEDQSPFTLLLPHRCPLSQKGISLSAREPANSALQNSWAHHPRVLHHPWAPTAILRGSAVTSFHNHFLPS